MPEKDETAVLRGRLEALEQVGRQDELLEVSKEIRDLLLEQHASSSVAERVGVVVLGIVLGWLLIYVGAQAAPEAIYWPVKFIVEA